MADQKIRFEAEELQLLIDKSFFVHKNAITKKFQLLFGDINDKLRKNIISHKPHFENAWEFQKAKISKGENYKGFPYMVLDYPKLYSRESVLAFRTMFWWGHYFSCHLHIQGKAKKIYEDSIIRNINQLRNREIYIGISHTPWQYHFDKSNYVAIDEMTEAALNKTIQGQSFIKFGSKTSLKEWQSLASTACSDLQAYLDIL